MTELSKVSTAEVYRYMGFRDEIPEIHIREMTEKIINELAEVASPRFLCKDTDLKITDNKVEFSGFIVDSKNLAAHLRDCQGGVIFAATLGSSVDMLIYKYSMISPAKAVAAQSAASAMIEMYADELCEEYSGELANNGLNLTPRFSPGYGDFPLEHQKDILRVLDAEKTIGLCVTDSDMLTPVKSITAVMGKTKIKYDCKSNKCHRCLNTGCAYRKE